MLPTIMRKGRSEQFRLHSNFHSHNDLVPEPAPHPKFSVTTNSYKNPPKTEQRQRTPYEPKLIIRYEKSIRQSFRNTGLSDQIKQLDRKIRQCERRIRQSKRKELQQTKPAFIFQWYLEQDTADTKKSFQMPDMNRFDFLTNPGKRQDEQQQEDMEVPEEQELPSSQPQATIGNFVQQNVEKLAVHYAKDLKRKFQRRQVMPHKACRRKNPKLFITHQTNAIQKTGKPLTQQEHIFRVYTREVTPHEIYPSIPNFPVVRDNISKNIAAYLIDFKPFIQKTKQEYPIMAEKLDKKDNSNQQASETGEDIATEERQNQQLDPVQNQTQVQEA